MTGASGGHVELEPTATRSAHTAPTTPKSTQLLNVHPAALRREGFSVRVLDRHGAGYRG
jgi:hypothetical protein